MGRWHKKRHEETENKERTSGILDRNNWKLYVEKDKTLND
jgi:hypothetical protein